LERQNQAYLKDIEMAKYHEERGKKEKEGPYLAFFLKLAIKLKKMREN